jgi:hypothetical protein
MHRFVELAYARSWRTKRDVHGRWQVDCLDGVIDGNAMLAWSGVNHTV